MEQATSCEPEPLVNDSANVAQSEFLCDELVMSSYVLEGILSHEPLEVSILLDDVGCVQVVDVSALHAKSYENLPMHVETTPPFNTERYTLVFRSEFVAHLREADLLDYLKTVNRAATLAVTFELFRHQVAHHCLQSHGLTGKTEPHSSKSLDRAFGKASWNLPLRCRDV